MIGHRELLTGLSMVLCLTLCLGSAIAEDAPVDVPLQKALRQVTKASAPAIVAIRTEAPAAATPILKRVPGIGQHFKGLEQQGGQGDLQRAQKEFRESLQEAQELYQDAYQHAFEQYSEALKRNNPGLKFHVTPRQPNPPKVAFGPYTGWKRTVATGATPAIRRQTGCGFFIDEAGHILTAANVVKNAKKIMVALPDGKERAAQIKAIDGPTNLAVIKIEGEGYEALEFGDPGELRLGTLVVACGKPYGAGPSFNVGVLSSVGVRNLPGLRGQELVQFGVPAGSSSAGGPLLGLDGKVLGVIMATMRQGTNMRGSSFAVPATRAKDIALQLKEGKAIRRGFLGIQVGELTDAARERLNLPTEVGALVVKLIPGSPAEAAGLQPDDLIIELAGRPIRSSSDLIATVQAQAPDATIAVKIVRQGKEIVVEVKLATRPNEI